MRFGAAILGLALLGSLPAYAGPSFCTGTTTVVTSGTFVPGSDLVNIGPGTSTGNCIEASDKIFGGFTVGGAITGGGSAGWLFTMATGPADVTIGLQGLVGPNSTGFIDYKVAIDPALSNGALINALTKDFTLNPINTLLASTATLTGVTSPIAGAPIIGGDPGPPFSCTRTGSTSTCPETASFSPMTALLTVDETITTGANTNVTALTDTVHQAVDEPRTLAILGMALIMLWMSTHNRRYS